MRARLFLLQIAALALVGCERFTGANQQKTLDAEAIGYACRVSLKTPEDCMKENDTHSPTSVLYGWKEADRDIKEKAIDPTMGRHAPQAPQSALPAAENKPAVAPESKPVAEKAPESTAAAKAGKTAAAAGKPAQGTAEKPAGR